jgi:hypothetical protein
MILGILNILSSVGDVFFICIYAIIGTRAPENVNVNCFAQDFWYQPYGRPAFFRMSVPCWWRH